MNEPSLNRIEDYETLSGEKRRVVFAVVAACLLVGTIFVGAKVFFGSVNDELPTEKIGKVPFK